MPLVFNENKSKKLKHLNLIDFHGIRQRNHRPRMSYYCLDDILKHSHISELNLNKIPVVKKPLVRHVFRTYPIKQ